MCMGLFFQPGRDWDWGPKKFSTETGSRLELEAKNFWSRLGLGSEFFFPHRDWFETGPGVQKIFSQDWDQGQKKMFSTETGSRLEMEAKKFLVETWTLEF